MVARGICFEDARREFEKKFIANVLSKSDGNLCQAADVLGIHAEKTDVASGKLDHLAYVGVARQITERFQQVSRVAITLRESISADHNRWGAMLYSVPGQHACFAPRDERGNYRPYEITHIVDRVGAGDSFAAGLIYALNTAELVRDPQLALSFAVAASCLKHSVQGDFNYVTKEEVLALMGGNASGRVQR